MYAIGRRDKRSVGLTAFVVRVRNGELLRRYAPVAIFVLRNQAVVLIFCKHVRQPFAQIWITVDNGLFVAELPVKHIAGHRKDGRPRHIVLVIVPEGWGDVRQGTV